MTSYDVGAIPQIERLYNVFLVSQPIQTLLKYLIEDVLATFLYRLDDVET